jgi:hypothetical protein
MSKKAYARSIRMAAAGIAIVLAGWASPSAQAQTYKGMLTWHNDNQRTGQNVAETVLTPANVNATSFGKLFSFPVDGQVYAQPLFVYDVTIPNQGVHNVVYVATENDSVYAFDADGLVSTPLWHDSFLSTGVTPVPCGDAPGTCSSISPTFGITGTPVIDGLNGTLYLVAITAENGSYVQRLHALDITTGDEKFGGPVVIQATVAGTGGGSVHGKLSFAPIHEIQRSGLLLSNGIVYIAWAGYGNPPWHGWILGYNAQTLKQAIVYNDTVDGERGGIWGAGGGLPADVDGNVYVMTGDGTFDGNTGGVDYGDSFLKLTPNGSGGLTVTDYFTPFNQDYLSENDMDLGSGGVMILPPQTGANPSEVIGGGKEGMIFVVNRNNMGQYSSTENNNTQTVTTSSSGLWSGPAYWNGAVYYAGVASPLGRYTLIKGLLSTTPVSQSVAVFQYPGATPSVSSNGAKNGIVWLIEDTAGRVKGGPPADLRAYNAVNLSQQLYGSSQSGNRDLPGAAVKFAVPTIINGKVYVGTQTELDIYGLLPAAAAN